MSGPLAAFCSWKSNMQNFCVSALTVHTLNPTDQFRPLYTPYNWYLPVLCSSTYALIVLIQVWGMLQNRPPQSVHHGNTHYDDF